MEQNLFKQAIAEAKTVREIAIANAKNSLAESFTPKIKSMFAAKLQENEELEENELEEYGNEHEMDLEDSFNDNPEGVDNKNSGAPIENLLMDKHERAVRDAYAQGLDVPSEVLKDYPQVVLKTKRNIKSAVSVIFMFLFFFSRPAVSKYRVYPPLRPFPVHLKLLEPVSEEIKDFIHLSIIFL